MAEETDRNVVREVDRISGFSYLHPSLLLVPGLLKRTLPCNLVSYDRAEDRLTYLEIDVLHWEFYNDTVSQLDETERNTLLSITKQFERAAFAPGATHTNAAPTVIEAAKQLIERSQLRGA